jgi:glycerol uptake facilitator-like aquaporin
MKHSRELLAEFIGTFVLIFTGTGAVMVDKISNGAVTHLGISIVFGAVLAFWSGGFFRRSLVMPYILAQSLGAIAASGLLRISLGAVGNLGATMPRNGDWMQSLVLETVLTFILMLTIFGSGLDRRAPIGFAGIAIGLTVALEAACMGPITGASMNPARSLAPALVGWNWQHHWLYWVAPILGAQLAMLVYRHLSNNFSDLKN